MRYLIQGLVMLGDLMIIGAATFVICFEPLNPFVWLLVFLSFKTWHDTGGFQAWNPKIIKQFLINAK